MQKKIDQVIAVLQQAVKDFSPVCFANSLGAEDMVLTDIIARHGMDIEMFSLDTGRLPQETYELMQELPGHYGVPLEIFFPDSAAVEKYVAQNGMNGFYDSVEARKGCCFVRKVEPLRRALSGKQAWITGLRREQAVTRGTLEVSAYDAEFGLQKFNPLLDWTSKDVWSYIRRCDVPYNKLHDKFYPSIGCAPCTRSISAGEDIRAGRWWWENPESKECGLHLQSAAGQSPVALRVSVQGNVGSVAHDVSRNQNLHNNRTVGQGNVGGVAHDVNLPKSDSTVSRGSLQASRDKIQKISGQIHATEKTVA